MDTPNVLPLTIGCVTRVVDVEPIGDDRLVTRTEVAVAKVGRTGDKLWPVRVTFWRQADGSWRAAPSLTLVRKPARIIAWNDTAFGDRLARR